VPLCLLVGYHTAVLIAIFLAGGWAFAADSFGRFALIRQKPEIIALW
jgi:hypothetical protein